MSIRRREDVDPADGIGKYGEVAFGDPVNNLYPIDTPEHVRAAWARIHAGHNAAFYSPDELELIKHRIVHAAKRLGVALGQEVVERDARLFTAGDYPDRGIEVTEADLDRMVESHKPVPIKIEHADTALDLGTVTRIWRKGRDLFGRLAFTAPAWALLEACGAKKLSAAIKRDKSAVMEVSIVRSPRVEGAAVFSDWDPVRFTFDIDEGGEEMSEEFSKRIDDLERQLKVGEVDSRIDALKRDGKLAPAAEEMARAILSTGDAQVVTFADGVETPVAEAFLSFLDAQPKVIEFAETAGGAGDEVPMSDEEREFYSRLGIAPEAVARQRAR